MNYNEFFLRLLKEAAMPTHPSASETDGLAQQAVAGDDGDLDAVNDSFGMPDDAAAKINADRQEVYNKFRSELESTLKMKGDLSVKAKKYEDLQSKIRKILNVKAPVAAETNDYDILANILKNDGDFQLQLDDAKTTIQNFLKRKEELDKAKKELEDDGNEDEFEEPPTLPMQ